MKQKLAILIIALFLPLHAFATTTLYLSPTGSDSNSGLSASQPLKTLQAANDKLHQLDPTDAVDVKVAPGIYYFQVVKWNFINGQDITIESSDPASKPVFQGNPDIPYDETYFFEVSFPTRRSAKISLRFLQIQNYVMGVLFKNADDNTVWGNTFTKIGTKYVRRWNGFKALGFTSSSNNWVKYNNFIDLEDIEDSSICLAGSNPLRCLTVDVMHGVYLANFSQNNLIEHNYFKNISSDPIRFRNGSSHNEIRGNSFNQSGTNAAVSTWLINEDNPNTPQDDRECPSSDNIVKFNRVNTLYNGSQMGNEWNNKGYGSSDVSFCADQTPSNQQINTLTNYKICGGLPYNDGRLYCDDVVNEYYQLILGRNATDSEMADSIGRLRANTSWDDERKIISAKKTVSFISKACCGYDGEHLHASNSTGAISMYGNLTINTGSQWSIQYLDTYNKIFFQGTGNLNGRYLAVNGQSELYLTSSGSDAGQWQILKNNGNVYFKYVKNDSNNGRYLVVDTVTGAVRLVVGSSTTGAKWEILDRN